MFPVCSFPILGQGCSSQDSHFALLKKGCVSLRQGAKGSDERTSKTPPKQSLDEAPSGVEMRVRAGPLAKSGPHSAETVHRENRRWGSAPSSGSFLDG